ncbi:IDEAL domain-containing protein [Sporosarcina sp. FSL K6-1522]|uniref:IDEAL domain-containing protein n=1 Tax=Sporosarcina sp. FSL K6-1522 TaxID=2921554 RepID=UPI00315A44ED
MHSDNSDFIKKLMMASMQMSLNSALTDLQNDSKLRERLREAFRLTDKQYRSLECHDSIQTDVTDADMLLLQIDHALDCGDAERFMALTDELKGMGVLV